MTDAKLHGPEATPLEGRVFRPVTHQELVDAVEQAFDYRGDVTLHLKSGATVEGYLYNLTATGPRPLIQVFAKGRTEPLSVPYADVAAIAFTGKDTASGKSWEAWVAKKESQRLAEAEQAAAEARARGHL